MDKILNLVSAKLTEKGLIKAEIARIIKDIFNILEEGVDSSLHAISQRLHSLGWKEEIMDEHCFQLITFLFESRK